MLKNVFISKSFYWLGESLNNCYDCKYCRAKPNNKLNYNITPSKINPYFKTLPVVINLFYGDPLLQIKNTKYYLNQLEENQHTAPVIIITKGNLKNLGSMNYNLNINIALSTIGKSHKLDEISHINFLNNLEYLKTYENIKFSCEFRPIMYKINDDEKTIKNLIKICSDYNLPIGYSGIQGKPELIKYWNDNNININPFPGYNLGVKKPISKECFDIIKYYSSKYNVKIFKKTSCLVSYTNNLNRDYNAHYYRPNELMCGDCPMNMKCVNFKNNLSLDDTKLKNIIPFKFTITHKNNHKCLMHRSCPNPHPDCTKINGNLIKIDKKITTADVRIIKWLSGYTVVAPFYESNYISKEWLTQ